MGERSRKSRFRFLREAIIREVHMYPETTVQQEENKLHDIYITREIYFDEKTGFYVAAMGDGNSVKINGAILPVKGDVTVFGAWKDDARYGHQLHAKQLYFKDPKA